jgi:hypothetical protein
MNTNVGKIDRVLRIGAGIALIALALGVLPDYQTPWGWLGLIPLATGAFGTCPVYSLLGIQTCSST